MEVERAQAMSMLDADMDSKLNLANYTETGLFESSFGQMTSGTNERCLTGWSWWQDYYYPYVIRESYPIYIRERAHDSGKKAFEIIKMLNDKNLLKIEKVKDFVKIMDELIKML